MPVGGLGSFDVRIGWLCYVFERQFTSILLDDGLENLPSD
jgi:hypothetical protein